MEAVTIGVLGLGDHSTRAHLDPLRSVSGAQVVSGYDPNPLAVASFERAFPDAKTAASAEALLASAVDAVLIMGPDRVHLEQAEAAVRAGKHVLCEKPLAESTQDFDRLAAMLEAAGAAKLVFTSCHPRRFDLPFVAFRDRLAEFTTRLGSVVHLDFDFSYHRPSKSGLHAGLLIDHVNHEVDLLNFLFGDSDFGIYRLSDSQTHYAVAGARTDGVTFAFRGTRRLESRIYPESFLVRFERGEVRVFTDSGEMMLRDHDRGTVEHGQLGATDYELRFQRVNENFIAAIRGQAGNYLSPQDLRVNTESGAALTETGVYRSSR